MFPKPDPARRYNRLLDAAGISPAAQLRLDAVRARIADRSLAAVKRYGRGRALDVGAGSLVFADEFRPHFAGYLTLDYERRSPRLQVRGDGQRLPFPAAIFDTVVSIDVLEHGPQPWLMFAEVCRVLADNGHLILVTPFFFWAHEEPNDFYRVSKYGLAWLCQQHGLEVLSLEPTCGFIASLGLLVTIAITRVFHRLPPLLSLALRVSRALQHSLLLGLDDRLDRSKRLAQGHILVARKTRAKHASG